MQSPAATEMLEIAADAARSKCGEDLMALNVSQPLPLVDIFLLMTGNSRARRRCDRRRGRGSHD